MDTSHSPAVCSVFHGAIELIGRRWTGAIISVLLERPCRYATLRAAMPDITDRMLSERLRELEQEGIVTRTVVPETPVRVEYALTAKGRALGDAIAAIRAWAHEWAPPGAAGAAEPAAPDPADAARPRAAGRRTAPAR